MYLDYGSYAQMGGELDPDVYERLAAKAERLIDRATHARLKAQSTVPMSVKYCIMELIDAIQADESMGSMSAGREISSMSNDGVSVAYASPESRCKALNDDITQLIDSVTGDLAYRGVD